jgi:hypothetical protein
MSLAIRGNSASPTGDTMATSPDGSNNWWVVAGTIAATLAGAILKTFVDLVGRRDSFAEKWRTDMIAETKALREWNGHQQEQLNASVMRMTTLEKAVHDEKELRHEIRNQLHAKMMELEGLKHDYQALKTEYEKVVALYDALCKSTGTLGMGGGTA